MATGYLVTLGDGILDAGDVISGAAITFTDDVLLGAGRWIWSGTAGGTTFTNTSEPGQYILATDGNTYFVPDFGLVDTLDASTVETAPPPIVTADGTVSGTDGDDFITFGYDDDPSQETITRGADTVEAGDGNDTIATAAGDDTIQAGAGNDTVSGGAGDDTIDGDIGNDVLIGDQMTNADGEDSISGGAGDDIIYGDSQTVAGSTAETTVFQWSTQGLADEVDVSDGLSGLTANGDVRVTLSVDEETNFTSATMELNDPLFNYNGLSDTSSIALEGGTAGSSGTSADAGVIRLDFSAGSAGFVDEVSDVTFGIFDLDELDNQFIDQIIVRAYDADGNLVPVTLSLSGQDPLNPTITTSTDPSGFATATSVVNSGGAGNTDSASGFVQVSVVGPVAQIEIEYNNIDPDFGNHAIRLGDIELTSIPAVDNEGANDTLDGGTGNDEIFGQGGDDSIQGGTGEDSLFGGVGNDIIDDSGTTADTIDGGDGNDTITAGGGADSIAGGDGEDSIRGEGGNDEIFGGAGNDNIRGDGGNDEVFGGADNDSIQGNAGEDTVFGGAGDDNLNSGTGNDTLDGGADDDTLTGSSGNDTFFSSTGNDINFGGTGNDTFVVTDDSDSETITGGEDVGDGDIDVVTFGTPTSTAGVTVDYTGAEAGIYDYDGTTAAGSFSEIERLETTDFDDTIDASLATTTVTIDAGEGADTITSGAGDDIIDLGTNPAGTDTDGDADVVVLTDGFGDDVISNLAAPTPNGDGTFTGTDSFDTTSLNDSEGVPVNTNDVTVSDDGSGNAVLTFPNGESVTLIGIPSADADNPEYLTALGIPLAPAEDGVVTGSQSADTINAGFTGDPDGDVVDANDQLIAGEAANDDIIVAQGGDDSVEAGVGNDDVYGGDGADTIDAGAGDDTVYGDTPDGGPWFYEYYDLDPAGNPTNLAEAGFANGTSNFEGVPTDVGYIDDLNPALIDAADDYALKYTSTLIVDAAGDYTFALASDDGARIFIDGVEVVDNDGLHNDSVTVTGLPVNLSAGEHTIEIIFFENDGGNVLTPTISGPDTSSTPTALSGYDNLRVAEGDDVITGGTGDDTLFGGTGDDQFNVAEADDTDTITGGEDADGNDVDTVTFDSVSNIDGVDVTFTGDEEGSYQVGTAGSDGTFTEIERIVGTDNADTVDLSGDSAGITVETGAGDDTLTSGQGDDVLTSGTGDDVINIDEVAGTDTITGGEDGGGADVDTVDFSGVGGPDGVTITYDGDESADYAVGAGSDGTFDDIEAVIGSDNADTVDATLDTVGIDVTTGAGNDTITGGQGDDDITAGAGDDTISLNTAFGDDTIVGGEDVGGGDVDVLDAMGITSDIVLDISSPETGTLTTGGDTATFSEIEEIVLGSGDDTVTGSAGNDTVDLGQGADTINAGAGNDVIDLGQDSPGNPDQDPDVVVLEDSFGDDIVSNFDAPTPNGDGTFTGIDTLDVTNLNDTTATPVTVSDVTVTDDGSGNAVLSFPAGESITLVGISPTDADDPNYLEAIGIPADPPGVQDGIVSGDAADNTIDLAYAGDPDGDFVDADDALLAGEVDNDDIIEGLGGNDSIIGGDGDDQIFGDAAADPDAGIGQPIGQLFTDASNIQAGSFSSADGTSAINDAQPGDSIIYENAATLADGSDVAIRVTVVSVSDPDVTVILNDGQASSPLRVVGGSDEIGDTVKFKVEFLDQLTGEPLTLTGNATVVDIDDNSNFTNFDGNEFVQFDENDIESFSVSGTPATSLTVNNTGGVVTASGTQNNSAADEDAWIGVGFEDRSEINFTVGVVQGTANYGFSGLDLTDPVTTEVTGGDDIIDGGVGNDYIAGNGGDDILTGGEGDDTILGGTGTDTIFGGGGDIVIGGEDADGLDVDVLNAGAAVSVAYTDVDGNPVAGPTEFGTVTYVDGTTLTFSEIETLNLTILDGTVSGTTGNDVIDGSYVGDPDGDIVDNQDAILPGDTGNDDLIEAGAGNDTIFAGDGNDEVFGGTGNDTIFAGEGDDTLLGQEGTDTFIIDEDDDSDVIVGGETPGDADVLTFENVGTTDGVTVTVTSDEQGTYQVGTAGSDGAFTEIEEIVGTDNADTVDLSGDTGGMNVDAGAGDDTITSGQGADTLNGETGDDTIVLNDDFGDDIIDGGADAGDTDTDVLDGSGLTQDVTVNLSAPETGTIDNGADTASFSEIEEIALGSGDDSVIGSAGNDTVDLGQGTDTINAGAGNDVINLGEDSPGNPDQDPDVVVLEDDFGDDIITNFDAPTPDGDGTFTGIDTLDVTDLFDRPVGDPTREPVNTNDVVVTDDGSGNAVLTFPNGETLTLVGIPPADADNPFYLNAIGIPLPDGTVSGDNTGNLIDGSYLGDPDGDIVDNDDAILAGDTVNDDLIEANGGDDTVFAGDGNDEVYGGTGNDTLDGDVGNDTLFGEAGNDIITIGEADGTDAITGGEDVGDADLDIVDFSGVSGAEGVDVDFTGDEAGDYQVGAAGSDGTFTEIEGIIGSDNADDINLSGDTTGISVDAGTGDDVITGGTGDDVINAGAGQDDVIIGDNFGNDDIDGGAVADGTGDVLDGSALTQDVTVDYTASETGTIDNGVDTADFAEIEEIITGSGDDTVIGGVGNDVVSTGDGVDTIAGGAGDDTFDAGSGDDTIDGGTGDDSITAGTGDDTVQLNDGFGNDTIVAGEDPSGTDVDVLDATGVTDDTTLDLTAPETGTITDGVGTASLAEIEQFFLGSGNDTATGSTGDDFIDLGQGDDTIDAGQGDDTVAGGLGDDAIVLSNLFGNDTITGGEDVGGADTDILDATGVTDNTVLNLTAPETGTITDGSDTTSLAEIEEFFLGSGDDSATGSIGNDTVDLGAGDDSINAGTGDDSVTGGTGDDTIAITDTFGNDTIDAGEDVGDGDVDVLDGSGLTDDVTVTLTGSEVGTVTDGVDTLSFTNVEEIETGSGDDTIIGGTGDDSVSTGAGVDTITGGAGNDTFDAGAGDDTIAGGVGDDSITAGTGDDTIVITDDFGNDNVVAGEDLAGLDVDILDGSGLTDDVTVTLTGDEVGTVTDGTDTMSFDNVEEIVTGSGDDTVVGGTGDDSVSTGAGNDVISGGAGADTFDAGAGNDVITFAEGDNLDGGDGDDTFILEDLGEPTNGVITIVGGDGDEAPVDPVAETGGDILQLGNLADLSTLVQTSDGLNASGNETFSGTVELDDGTTLNFSGIEQVICFTPGTNIATPRGSRPIETLRVGDMVVTRDHGMQPIRWIEQRTVPATDKFAPVRLRPGTVTGLERDLLVSPQHRMLFQGYRAELLFGESEVLMPATHLVDGKAVTREEGGFITYIHMMFDEHEVVYAEGAASESFHPGEIGLTGVSDAAREELFALFPQLRSDPTVYGRTARRTLKKHESQMLRTK